MNDKGRGKGGVSCGGSGHFFETISMSDGFSTITRRLFSTRRLMTLLRYAVAIHLPDLQAINMIAALQLWIRGFQIQGLLIRGSECRNLDFRDV